MGASVARKLTRLGPRVLRHQLAQVCASSCLMTCFSCAAIVFRYSKRARTFFTQVCLRKSYACYLKFRRARPQCVVLHTLVLMYSWWQRLKAAADETFEHHDPLPQAIFKKLKPIYMCLASKDLFQRCLRCATQNAEFFYGHVWSYCVELIQWHACSLVVLQFDNCMCQSHTGCTAGGYGLLNCRAQHKCTGTRGQDVYSQEWEEDRNTPWEQVAEEGQKKKKERQERTSCGWGRYNLQIWSLLNNF